MDRDWPDRFRARAELSGSAGHPARHAGLRRRLYAIGGRRCGLAGFGRQARNRHLLHLVGWALAIAVGLPLVSLIAPQIGWQATYGLIGILAAVSFLALLRALPRGLQAKPIIFATWGEVGRSRDLMFLLLITCLIAIGQYVVIAFAGPLLIQLTNATPARIAAVFALFGAMTLVGNICASRVVQTWGAFRTSAVFMAFMVLGVTLWAFGAGIYLSMAAGAAIWGLDLQP